MPDAAHHTLSVPRTARFSMLGGGPPPGECWYVCHGYAQLARRFIRRFESLATEDRWVVAPEGLSRFYVRGGAGQVGASWMTREDREEEIADYLRYLDQLHAHLHGAEGPGPRVMMLGFSQGCATASRWAARGSARPRRLILWGEVQAHDLTEEDLRRYREADLSVDFVVGRRDEAVSVAKVEEAAGRLREAGVHVRIGVFDGGHEIDEPTLLRLGESRVDD